MLISAERATGVRTRHARKPRVDGPHQLARHPGDATSIVTLAHIIDMRFAPPSRDLLDRAAGPERLGRS